MRRAALFTAAVVSLWAASAEAVIDGLSGTTFSLTARADRITTGDGNSLLFWGYAVGAGRAQYPGPTLIVTQGATVRITLRNELAVPVSMVFPGQEGVTASGGSPGLVTREALPGGSGVIYTFVASNPGTYYYASGTNPEIQNEMGLFGAIVVRPSGFSATTPANRRAYDHADSRYDREYLFLLSEMDPRIHLLVEFGGGLNALTATDYLSDYFANYWFFNGRNAPDTMAAAASPLFPTQPYNIVPRMHPGERLLMRVIGGGRDLHPFHTHGNHARIIARDGRLLRSAPAAGADLAFDVFTIQSVPGSTFDAIWEWTGKGLGFDIYGTTPHTCTPDANGFDVTTREWCADHGKPFPVALPDQRNLFFGEFYHFTPFLGVPGLVPPGLTQLNPTAAYMHMWHSHTEKEMTNYDIFPGGMMTMVIIELLGVPIP
jgi:hypothetical protein